MLNLRRKPAIERSFMALIGAFVLAFVHQYLFYGNDLGVSFPIFVLLFYLYMVHDIKDRLRLIPWFGWFLFVIILMLTMTYAMFNNPIFYALNFVVVLSLIFAHLAYIRSEKKLEWWDIRLVGSALDHLIPQSLRHIPTVLRILKISTVRKMGNRQKSAVGKVLIGLVIAVPLLAIVINLLASADGVFNRLLMGFPEWLSHLSIGESIARGIWIVIFGVVFFGYLWGFVKPKYSRRVVEAEDGETGSERLKVDPIILATVLISVNVVYVLFVCVQFAYLFGAGNGVLPDGKTYAEYARSGFVELVVVTVINFAILMVTLVYSGMKESGILGKINAILLYILVGCSGVMLYSAYMRLILYEEVYGYTYIRFLVHAFMIYLGILLVIAALRIWSEAIPLAKCFIVISLFAYVLINYVGVDRIIAENNIERFRETGKIDARYLSELSTDSIPLLIRFSKEEYPEMKPYLKKRFAELVEVDYDWQSFNVSRHRAVKELYSFIEVP
ncbi:DUF4153 domain-containing protein [Cohnella silvisoli]|uniref:DUF4173 domain-containing protein n=1 Tax=Cohnella silvisoli TaxID=2873699 RepID=A0ABV1KQH3_9BACL|nr:DUF4173 domain-containing protein [Cohnella silvisoli]MCD9022107.1 DUF4173 domain-containing protein [Cohnella silvisoli]